MSARHGETRVVFGNRGSRLRLGIGSRRLERWSVRAWAGRNGRSGTRGLSRRGWVVRLARAGLVMDGRVMLKVGSRRSWLLDGKMIIQLAQLLRLDLTLAPSTIVPDSIACMWATHSLALQ